MLPTCWSMNVTPEFNKDSVGAGLSERRTARITGEVGAIHRIAGQARSHG